jgi:hypothetical protein
MIALNSSFMSLAIPGCSCANYIHRHQAEGFRQTDFFNLMPKALSLEPRFIIPAKLS